MTKISIYNVDGNVAGNDRWIGTDAQNFNATKNFTPNGLADYFNHNQVIDSGNALRYTYQTLDPLEARRFGTISFITEIGPQVPFEEINTFLLSKYTLKYNIVSEYLQFLNGANVVISKASDTNFFGLYKITNVNVYLPEPNFFNVDLSFIDGNGSMNEDQDYIISLVLDKYDQIPTKTSDLTNDGADGVHPFITAQDIPPSASTLQDVVNNGNGISNYGGIGHADIQSTNFTNNRTLYINNNAFPTIKIVDNANASHNLTIDLDTLNLNGTSYNWSSIVDGVPQNLQQVTDIGNTTTNSIISQDSNYYSIIEPSDIGTENISTGAYTYLGADGVIGIKTGNFEGDIKTTNLTNGLTLEFPDKPAGVYTIATTSDIPVYTTPTLQSVTTAGSTTTNPIIIYDGLKNSYLYSLGLNLSRTETGIANTLNVDTVNGLQMNFNVTGTGQYINSIQIGGFVTQHFDNGNQASLTADGGLTIKTKSSLFSPGTANLKADLLTGNRTYQFPDSAGTLALISQIQTVGFEQNFLLMGS